MNRSGIVTKLKLFYAIVMTYDFQYSKILRRRGMKLNDNVIFGKKDILKLRLFKLSALLFVVFINIGLVYGVLNSRSIMALDDSVYFYIDENKSYQFKLDDDMKIYDSYLYEGGEYKEHSNFSNCYISSAMENIASNNNENIIGITFVQTNDKNKEQLKLINNELNKFSEWSKKNYYEEDKIVVTGGSYSEYKYAKSKNLPIGKYIIYKHSDMVKSTIKELDLLGISINEMFNFKNDNKYIFAEDAFHIDDAEEEVTLNTETIVDETESPDKMPNNKKISILDNENKTTESPINTNDESNTTSFKPENNNQTETPIISPTEKSTNDPTKKTTIKPTSKKKTTENSTTTPTETPTPTETLTPTITPTETPTDMPIKNLALNKIVSVSDYIIGHEPKNTVDLDSSNNWATFIHKKNWIQIDLEENKNVSSIELTWSEKNYPENFELYSINDNKYNKIGSYDLTGGHQVISFDEINSRYLYLKLGDSRTNYLVLYDFKVLGY